MRDSLCHVFFYNNLAVCPDAELSRNLESPAIALVAYLSSV